MEAKNKIMSLDYVNQRSYDYKVNRNPEREWGESLTTPNQAYTVKEILARVIQGRPVPNVSIESLSRVQDTDNVTFDDTNPYQNDPDPLTVGDKIREELRELEEKAKSRDLSKKEAAKKAEIEKRAKELSDAKKFAEIEKRAKELSEKKEDPREDLQ